uniref:Zinc finger, CCHC-type n=1 Tax=Tanacetum cinerariifolium TaxID=118510 RepID=A0A6L2KX03_TANCI|nr:zinc finger, CCHC-type [Tanacetum cinerariifolium]
MAAAAMKHVASSFAKLEKFKGIDFRRWQKKMHFMIFSMSVVYVQTNPMPEDRGENPTVEQVRKRAKWDNDDYVCRGLILNDFKHTLKHLKEELTLIELGSHLRIEESLSVQDNVKPKGNNVVGPSVVNMVEHNNSFRYNDNKGKRKHHDTRANPNNKPKVTCWKCGKPGHLKKDCKAGNVGNIPNGSSTKGSEDGSSNPLKGQSMFNKSHQIYYVTYVSKAFFVQDDDVAWLLTLEQLCMCAKIDADLRFSSGKVVSLLNILHVSNIRKNLVSSSVLNNCGFKQVIESNKFVLSKHGVFIGFGYLSNHMFKLNIVFDNIGSAFMSTSKLNDSILWHARLGHVHFKRMQDMFKDGLIPAIDMDTKKCKTCMLKKITKKPFQNVKRKTKVLELIHSDLCDLHATSSLGNKKYFVTFIDDASRFCYVYLLHSKDKALDKFKVFKTKVELQQKSSGLIGEVPNKRNRITPYELWTIKKPNLNHLIVSGCREAVRLLDPKLKTLGEKGIDCIFVGYVEHSKALRFYVIEPNDSVAINSIIESRDAIFDEQSFSFVSRPSQRSLVKGTEDSGGSVVSERVTDEIVLTDLLLGCKPLGFKWIFKRKLKVEGNVETFKARLVIQGFKQKSGIEYFDTYSPVARISTIRLLIAMASIHNLIIHQMDVKTAFLDGKLEEEVYMNQPLGFIMPGNENKVCKLIKSLYGLKQAPKQWHQMFDEVVDLTKKFLSSRFSMKDMGEANGIFGIKIKHESNGIEISQSHYIAKVLKNFNYSDCTPFSTPLDTYEKLMPKRGLVVSQHEYSKVIGCLMYVITCTRPDIAFVVGKLSRLVYFGYPLVLEGYIDASWICNTEDNSSTSCWVFLLGSGVISWAFKKQTCITGSTMESKFVALEAAGNEAEWLKNLLFEIPLCVKPMAHISINCESAATLAKAYNQIYNGKSRHLGIRHSMIRELITNGVVSIEFVRLQKIVSQLAVLGEYISQEDLNLKFLISLPSEWNTHVVVWRNKPDIDTMSIDDLYNNFKIVKQEVKGTASSNSSSQDMAFVSYPSTNSTNKVYTTYGKTRKKITINGSDTDDFDKSKVECYNCHKMGHFATESKGHRNQDSINKYQDSSRRNVQVEETSPKAMVAIDGVGSQIPDNSKKISGYESYHAVPPPPTRLFSPPKLDLSNSGLEEFKQPEFEGYGPKTSKSVSDDIPNELKAYPDAFLVKDRVTDNKYCSVESPIVVEKKTNIPTIAKVKVVRTKQQEKPVRKPVKYAEMYRVNQVNAVKASACPVWRPSTPNGASITLKRHNYIDVRGIFNQVEGMVKHQEIYVTPSHTKKIFANMKRQGKEFSSKVTPLFETMMKKKSKKSKKRITEVPQLSDSTYDVADEHVTITSNDPLSGEDRLKLTELMELCTQLHLRALALETTKANQALEIGSLKRKVKKLEKKVSKKTNKLKRLYKIGSSTRVESSKDTCLGDQEDASKQRRMIDDLDADEGVALVNETQERNDQDMFDTSVLDDEEVVAEKEVSTVDLVTTDGEEVTTAGVEVSTAVITSQISMDDITLAKALIDIKISKPKAKEIVIQEPEDQIMIDEEVVRNLKAQMQAELEEEVNHEFQQEERLVRQKEKEANIALIESWDNTQDMMVANYELAARLQEEERGELTIEEKSRLFMKLMVKRKKHFARLRAKKIKSKPPTKTQKRNQMCTYLKNMANYKHSQLKNKSFKEINVLFNNTIKWIDSFVPMDTELVKGSEKREEGSETRAERSSKRERKELESKKSKKKKLDEQVEVEVDNDQRESRDENHIDKKDLEILWKLVKAKYGNTRPEEGYERVLWGDLKVMFEPDIESEVWRTLQRNKVTIWKLFSSCGVYFVRFQNLHIFMLVEKRYPLTPATITEMLNTKLQANHWNEMCYQLLKLKLKQKKKK